MTWRASLAAIWLSLPVATTSPVVAQAADNTAKSRLQPAEVVEIFDATCASGRITALSLKEGFVAHGFTSDWQDESYGYFSRASLTANYHIYPGSWNCFVSGESLEVSDLCAILPADGAEISARLPDGTCVATLPERGFTVLVRDICPDSSQGACLWMQATRTLDRACHADDVSAVVALVQTLDPMDSIDLIGQ